MVVTDPHARLALGIRLYFAALILVGMLEVFWR